MPFATGALPVENTNGSTRTSPVISSWSTWADARLVLHIARAATALFDKPRVLDVRRARGAVGRRHQKLSKRLRNYPDPTEVFDTAGSDAMRWAMLSSAVLRGGDIAVDRRTMDESVRHVLMPIWNAWYFLSLYANAGGVKGKPITSAEHVLARYALARSTAGGRRHREEDVYDLSGACWSISAFSIAQHWYIRRTAIGRGG